MSATTAKITIPVGKIGGKFDNDDPAYVFAPDLYMALGLAYDSMAAPAAVKGEDGVWESDYTDMRPRLAVGWSEQPNGDWIVDLRPGVTSQRGNAFSASDLAWVMEKALAHSTLSSWRWRDVIGVERMEVVSPLRLHYHLRAPYPHFPNWLLSVAPNIVDATAIRSHASPADPWGIDWLNANVAGYGAYDMTHFDSETVLFERRADYWMGTPEAEQIEVRAVADRPSAFRMLDETRPVIVVGADPDETAPLLQRDDLQLQRVWAGHVSVEIDFNHPSFGDRRVRQALAYATPYSRLITEGLLGQARPWHSPVKGFSQWYSDAHTHYEHDPAKARALLREAGFGQGLRADFYLERRADCERMADLIANAWKEIGVELDFKDAADAPAGWLPPLYLRTECAHNLSEPIYDIVHDYAAMDPLTPAPGGPPHVGTWTPRWTKNPQAIERLLEVLDERDSERKHQLFMQLQDWLVDFCSSIFIAEGQQVLAANRLVPASLIAPDSRFFHAMLYQNCTTNYLPQRPPRPRVEDRWWGGQPIG